MQKVEPEKQLLVHLLDHHHQYNSIWTEEKIAQVVKISREEVRSYLGQEGNEAGQEKGSVAA